MKRRGRRGRDRLFVDEIDGAFVDRGEKAERGWVMRWCRGVPEKVEDGRGLWEERRRVVVEQLERSVLGLSEKDESF